jgi:hypothetical protein
LLGSDYIPFSAPQALLWSEGVASHLYVVAIPLVDDVVLAHQEQVSTAAAAGVAAAVAVAPGGKPAQEQAAAQGQAGRSAAEPEDVTAVAAGGERATTPPNPAKRARTDTGTPTPTPTPNRTHNLAVGNVYMNRMPGEQHSPRHVGWDELVPAHTTNALCTSLFPDQSYDWLRAHSLTLHASNLLLIAERCPKSVLVVLLTSAVYIRGGWRSTRAIAALSVWTQIYSVNW